MEKFKNTSITVGIVGLVITMLGCIIVSIPVMIIGGIALILGFGAFFLESCWEDISYYADSAFSNMFLIGIAMVVICIIGLIFIYVGPYSDITIKLSHKYKWLVNVLGVIGFIGFIFICTGFSTISSGSSDNTNHWANEAVNHANKAARGGVFQHYHQTKAVSAFMKGSSKGGK